MKLINRRKFVAASGMIGTSLALDVGLSAVQTPVGRGQSAAPQTPDTPAAPLTFQTKLHKALIARPTVDELKQMKAAGFEGVEARVLPPDEAAKMRKVAEGLGMRVHSVLYGWAEFNNPDKSEVDRTFAEAQDALRSAEAFGADAVLLVPCRIGPRGGRGAAAPSPAENIRMPRPWEFQIEFDDRTGHHRRVV
jgi:sugar phosphate isomerase/epimerase